MRSETARWWQRAWVAPTALALLPLLAFRRAPLLLSVFYACDAQHSFCPYHALPATMLKRGDLPLWNPFALPGMPLLTDGRTALTGHDWAGLHFRLDSPENVEADPTLSS